MSFSKKSKKKIISNPVIIPDVTLVDEVFKVAVYLLSLVGQDFKNRPFIASLTEGKIEDLLDDMHEFFLVLQDILDGVVAPEKAQIAVYPIVSFMKDNLEELGIGEEDIIYSELSSVTDQDEGMRVFKSSEADEEIDQDIPYKFQVFYNMFNSFQQREFLSQDISVRDHKIEAVLSARGLIYTSFSELFDMVPGVRRATIFDEETERVLMEVKPTHPEGWEMLPSFLLSDDHLTTTLASDIMAKRFGVDADFTVQLYRSNRNDLGAFGSSEDFNDMTLTLYFTPINGVVMPDLLPTLYSTIVHEMIHFYQHSKRRLLNNEFTGLPFPHNKQMSQHIINKHAERALKDLFKSQSLDPSVVDFYILDDMEFYTILFDEIIRFIKTAQRDGVCLRDAEGVSHPDIEGAMYEFMSKSQLFKSLKYVQPYKYEIAVYDFVNALKNRLDEIENSFVCKIITPSKVYRRNPSGASRLSTSQKRSSEGLGILRKNDHKLLLDTPLTESEKSILSKSLSDITNVATQGSGLPSLDAEVFLQFINEYGTKLVGVVFDPERGGTFLGPYVGSIAAFECPKMEVFFEFFDDFKCLTPDEIDEMKKFILSLKSRRFVYILERGRENTEYAKNETAKLNNSFYDYLCKNRYMFVSVCRESTSYKTYLRMAIEGRFRFFYDLRSPRGYLESPEPFHLIIGEFLSTSR